MKKQSRIYSLLFPDPVVEEVFNILLMIICAPFIMIYTEIYCLKKRLKRIVNKL